jgi:aspartate/methionine/tyrosine aminotransferase
MRGGRISIAEVAAVDYLCDLSHDYRRRHGRSPVELSYWDPSKSFLRSFAQKLRIPSLGDPFRYRYSYESDVRGDVLAKLGYRQGSRRILITENGTNAVLAAANALALLGVEQVRLLSPRYFATSYALAQLGIRIVPAYWRREAGRFLPPEFSLRADEALWIESPIFSTGVSCDRQVTSLLRQTVCSGHLVVCDRSLAPLPGAFDDELEANENYISLHAPHKTLCINGLKFGAVTFHSKWYDAFDHWQDVLSGGLSISAELATRHYVSPDFDAYAETVAEYAANASRSICELADNFGGSIEMDVDAQGYWRTVYVPRLAAELGTNRAWLADLVDRTGAVPIPGVFMGCDPAWGFCFRVNLLRYDAQFRGALRRLCSALDLEHQHQGTR